MIDIFHPVSYLGTPIYKTETARIGEAVRFFKVAQNLHIGRNYTIMKFARYIRHGLLSCKDAEDLLLGRLDPFKLRRYSLAKYWISSGFASEDMFYFKPSQLWPVVVPENQSITLFP